MNSASLNVSGHDVVCRLCIAGIISARRVAPTDPVQALRTESRQSQIWAGNPGLRNVFRGIYPLLTHVGILIFDYIIRAQGVYGACKDYVIRYRISRHRKLVRQRGHEGSPCLSDAGPLVLNCRQFPNPQKPRSRSHPHS